MSDISIDRIERLSGKADVACVSATEWMRVVGELLTTIEGLRESVRWKPITDRDPSDGLAVLVWVTGDEAPFVAKREGSDWFDILFGHELEGDRPSEFMEIPNH